MAALYTSLDVLTAIRESSRLGTLQPTTLVSYGADIEPIFDATDAELLARAGIDPDLLAAPNWREEMRAGGEAPSQALARRLAREGYAGIKVRSFVRSAGPGNLNLVLWVWGSELPARLVLADDEGRLSP